MGPIRSKDTLFEASLDSNGQATVKVSENDTGCNCEIVRGEESENLDLGEQLDDPMVVQFDYGKAAFEEKES